MHFTYLSYAWIKIRKHTSMILSQDSIEIMSTVYDSQVHKEWGLSRLSYLSLPQLFPLLQSEGPCLKIQHPLPQLLNWMDKKHELSAPLVLVWNNLSFVQFIQCTKGCNQHNLPLFPSSRVQPSQRDKFMQHTCSTARCCNISTYMAYWMFFCTILTSYRRYTIKQCSSTFQLCAFTRSLWNLLLLLFWAFSLITFNLTRINSKLGEYCI